MYEERNADERENRTQTIESHVGSQKRQAVTVAFRLSYFYFFAEFVLHLCRELH